MRRQTDVGGRSDQRSTFTTPQLANWNITRNKADSSRTVKNQEFYTRENARDAARDSYTTSPHAQKAPISPLVSPHVDHPKTSATLKKLIRVPPTATKTLTTSTKSKTSAPVINLGLKIR